MHRRASREKIYAAILQIVDLLVQLSELSHPGHYHHPMVVRCVHMRRGRMISSDHDTPTVRT